MTATIISFRDPTVDFLITDMMRAIYRSFDKWYGADITNHWAPVIRETPRTNQQVRDNLANNIVRNAPFVIYQIEVGI